MREYQKTIIINRGLSFYQYLALIIFTLYFSNVIDIPYWLLIAILAVAAIREEIRNL